MTLPLQSKVDWPGGVSCVTSGEKSIIEIEKREYINNKKDKENEDQLKQINDETDKDRDSINANNVHGNMVPSIVEDEKQHFLGN